MSPAKSPRRTAVRVLLALAGLALAAALAIVLMNVSIVRSSSPFIVPDLDQSPSAEVAIVLGENVDGGVPSLHLADRLDTAKMLLLSGDSDPQHDEVGTMNRYVTSEGVDQKDILTDTAGFTTWDTMKRAHDVFHVTDALVVTQRYHLSRAVYLARHFGLRVTGVPADRQKYDDLDDHVREYLARVKAFVQARVFS